VFILSLTPPDDATAVQVDIFADGAGASKAIEAS